MVAYVKKIIIMEEAREHGKGVGTGMRNVVRIGDVLGACSAQAR